MSRTEATRQEIDPKTTLSLIGMFVVVWVLWDTPIVYPIKIFVVCLHELGHAAAALLTGGEVVSIQVFPDQGGLTTARGGLPFIILSAGYTGSVLAGGALLYLSSYRRWGRVLMAALAALIALSTLLFFRNVFGIVYGLGIAGAMLFSASRLSEAVNYYVLRFVAVASCLYALLDIRSDLFVLQPADLSANGVITDAMALEHLTNIPALFWAIVWMVISIVMLFRFLSLSARVGDHSDTR